MTSFLKGGRRLVLLYKMEAFYKRIDEYCSDFFMCSQAIIRRETVQNRTRAYTSQGLLLYNFIVN